MKILTYKDSLIVAGILGAVAGAAHLYDGCQTPAPEKVVETSNDIRGQCAGQLGWMKENPKGRAELSTALQDCSPESCQPASFVDFFHRNWFEPEPTSPSKCAEQLTTDWLCGFGSHQSEKASDLFVPSPNPYVDVQWSNDTIASYIAPPTTVNQQCLPFWSEIFSAASPKTSSSSTQSDIKKITERIVEEADIRVNAPNPSEAASSALETLKQAKTIGEIFVIIDNLKEVGLYTELDIAEINTILPEANESDSMDTSELDSIKQDLLSIVQAAISETAQTDLDLHNGGQVSRILDNISRLSSLLNRAKYNEIITLAHVAESVQVVPIMESEILFHSFDPYFLLSRYLPKQSTEFTTASLELDQVSREDLKLLEKLWYINIALEYAEQGVSLDKFMLVTVPYCSQLDAQEITNQAIVDLFFLYNLKATEEETANRQIAEIIAFLMLQYKSVDEVKEIITDDKIFSLITRLYTINRTLEQRDYKSATTVNIQYMVNFAEHIESVIGTDMSQSLFINEIWQIFKFYYEHPDLQNAFQDKDFLRNIIALNRGLTMAEDVLVYFAYNPKKLTVSVTNKLLSDYRRGAELSVELALKSIKS